MNLWLPEGRDGVWESHIHVAVFKMDNQQGPTVSCMEPCLGLCDSLDEREVWGRMCIWLSPFAVHLKPPQHC